MKWNEVKETYPNQWLVVEALDAHTTSDSLRRVEKVSVIGKCADGEMAMAEYRRLHMVNPLKEYYFVHTSRDDLDIPERKWLGIRL